MNNRYKFNIVAFNSSRTVDTDFLYCNNIELFDIKLFLDSITDYDQEYVVWLIENKKLKELNVILDQYIDSIKNKKPKYGLTKYVVKLYINGINFHKKPSINSITPKNIQLLDKFEFNIDQRWMRSRVPEAGIFGSSEADNNYISHYIKQLDKDDVWTILQKILENPYIIDNYPSTNLFTLKTRGKGIYISLYITTQLKNKSISKVYPLLILYFYSTFAALCLAI